MSGRDEFAGFSEPARLFAKNAKIVRLMEKQYNDEMTAGLDKSTGLSEAARLFAENVKTVRLMKKQYNDEMATFCRGLHHRLATLIPDRLHFKESKTKDGTPLYTWWIGGGQSDYGAVGCAYLDSDISLVTENRLTVLVDGGLTKEGKARIRQIRDAPDFADFGFDGKPTWAYHFIGHLKLIDDDAVGFAARRLAALLQAIHAADAGQ